jgi:hypothetical protein
MNTPRVNANIKALRIEKQYETDKSGLTGSPLALSNCVCEVYGQTVRVEIDGQLMHDWEADEAHVKELVEIYLDGEINDGWSPSQSDRLVLDQRLAKSQGWKPRH